MGQRKQTYVRLQPGEWEILCAKAADLGLSNLEMASNSTVIRLLCGLGRANPGAEGSGGNWNRVQAWDGRNIGETTQERSPVRTSLRVAVTFYEPEIEDMRRQVGSKLKNDRSDSNLVRVMMGLAPLRRGSPLLISGKL